MIERTDSRIAALRIAAPRTLADHGIQPATVLAYTRLATDALNAGRIGYTLMIAEET
ncbi:hypothetical protein ACOJVU_04620 [Mycobacterium sp. THU-M104]|uniref:hypothetical protein n=1 Tax=Mycobacterium sp. THU-M104 TaxID=3410515 RepID=UPI003B9C0F47